MQIIDMTRTSWGHNIKTMSNDGEGHLKFAIWCTPGPKPGDELVYKVATGTNRAIIDEVKWPVNVDDMYFIEVTVIERIPRVQ